MLLPMALELTQFAPPVWHCLAGGLHGLAVSALPIQRGTHSPAQETALLQLHENFAVFDICVCWEAKRYRNTGNAEGGERGPAQLALGAGRGGQAGTDVPRAVQ